MKIRTIAYGFSLLSALYSCGPGPQKNETARPGEPGPETFPASDTVKKERYENHAEAVSPQKLAAYLDTIGAYCRKYRGKEALADNIYAYGTSGETLCISLMKNTAAFREQFRKKILNYPLTDFGDEYRPVIRHEESCDTCGAVLRAAPGHYPASAEQVRVRLENLSPDTLTFGEDYSVAFFNGRDWISLCGNNIVNSILILLAPGGAYEFTAFLEPRVNENKSGSYRIYKEATIMKTGKKFILTAPFELK